MKIIEFDFKPEDIKMMNDIVYHAISGLGLGYKNWDELGRPIESTNDHLISQKKFFDYLTNGTRIVAPVDIWSDFYHTYKEACKTLDPIEIETITDYKWEDSQKLSEKIKGIINSNQ